MDYKVLTVECTTYYEATKKLEREVRKFLDQDWKLHGGVAITFIPFGYTGSYVLAQAMVK